MIDGYFHPGSDSPLPYVRVSIWLPGITLQWMPIEFLIDTGAGRTSLHPLDALTRAGFALQKLVDPSLWDPHESPTGVGGNALYYITDAHYAFLTRDGNWHRVAGEIRVAQPTVTNLALPSLLGWDLLRDLPLAMNWAQRTISLG